MSGQRSRQGTRTAGLKARTGLARMSAKREQALRDSGRLRYGSTFGRPEPKPAKPGRNTGPSQETRGMVLVRDNWQCVACGKPAGGAFTSWSIQHRIARGQGGTNDLSNLIVLCGSATTGCHGKCEARDREMQARGYWLESWQNPAAEPVMVAAQDGGATVWLSDDGEYLLEAPEGAR